MFRRKINIRLLQPCAKAFITVFAAFSVKGQRKKGNGTMPQIDKIRSRQLSRLEKIVCNAVKRTALNRLVKKYGCDARLLNFFHQMGSLIQR